MPELMPEPVLTLPDRAALLAYLGEPLPDDGGLDKFHVKAVWLCELLERMFAEQGKRFAYNADVYLRACNELDLPEKIAQRYQPFDLAAKTLSTLVYNAQKYVRSDILKARGFTFLTQAMVDDAGATKRLIQTPSGTVYPVRKVGDKWYAMVKNSRKRYLRVDDPETLARIVDKHSLTDDMPPCEHYIMPG